MNSITLNGVSPKYFTPKTIATATTIWNKKTTFEKGNYYLVIAPSGSGKSTLATAILGNHFEYEGTITYDQAALKTQSIEKIVGFRKQQIQLLFQDVRMITDLTIRENIMLRTFGKKSADAEAKLQQYATTLGILPLLDKKAKNCSYGERQRSAILRSLINPTDFLLYDECFSHLDLNNKKIAYDLITGVAAQSGSTVIFFELNDFPFQHQCHILNL
jgi:putative ABC transport system ATP-binding protein